MYTTTTQGASTRTHTNARQPQTEPSARIQFIRQAKRNNTTQQQQKQLQQQQWPIALFSMVTTQPSHFWIVIVLVHIFSN